MPHADLFSGPLPAPSKSRRNSPLQPSAEAQRLVSGLDAEQRKLAAISLIKAFADLGVDRGALADGIGLSRSSTSHWHHGANSISAHNLAVLIDHMLRLVRPAVRMTGVILAYHPHENPWTKAALAVLDSPDLVRVADAAPWRECRSLEEFIEATAHPDGYAGPGVAEAAEVRGGITWEHHADGSFTSAGLCIEPGVDELDAEPTYKVTIDLEGSRPRRLTTDSLADAFAICQHMVEACT